MSLRAQASQPNTGEDKFGRSHVQSLLGEFKKSLGNLVRLSLTEKRAGVYLEGLVCLTHTRAWVRSARTAEGKQEEQARDSHAISDESLWDHTGRQDQENAGEEL